MAGGGWGRGSSGERRSWSLVSSRSYFRFSRINCIYEASGVSFFCFSSSRLYLFLRAFSVLPSNYCLISDHFLRQLLSSTIWSNLRSS